MKAEYAGESGSLQRDSVEREEYAEAQSAGQMETEEQDNARCLHTGLSVDDGIVIDKSRMNREVHARFRESLRVKVLLATRLGGRSLN